MSLYLREWQPKTGEIYCYYAVFEKIIMKTEWEAFHNQLSVIKREHSPPLLLLYLHFSKASLDGMIKLVIIRDQLFWKLLKSKLFE